MRITLVRKLIVSGLLAFFVVSSLHCFGGSKRTRRLSKKEIQERLKKLETPGLLIGEFPLARNDVIDGDTVRVAGLDTSLRLLAIDTEETFKSDADLRLFEAGFEKYLVAKRAGSVKPVKAATPLGEDAKKFAAEFFDGAKTVRLERDHPKEIRGRFNRYLAYIMVKKKGDWVNYNLECVRVGMSPYFTKYSYSRRFHDQFVQAQKEAQKKGLGIWDPGKQHYRDYPERLEWWNVRADFIKQFEEDAKGKDNHIVLTNWDALRRMEKFVGKEVVILSTVGEVKLGDKGPTKVMLSRRMMADFPLIFFDKGVFGSSRIARFSGEFVRVTGIVTRYRNRHDNREELQIEIKLPGQIVGSELSPNYSGWDTEGVEQEAEREADKPQPLPPKQPEVKKEGGK
ncbi:MAG: thermonuclease family protein [Deltaproteobacteria bacterium]|nr:thermonuclease family protein [Deltaproteobacteria bacterium]MBW1871436.1 thermonuclease family protein [Deltaproteobacteria bacterium]